MYGIEQVLAQVIAKLQADLPAKVAALNAEYADVYVLTVPATASYDTVFEEDTATALMARGGFPAVVVSPQPESVIDLPAMGDEYGIEHAIEVAVIVQVADWRVQQTLLMRYLRALKEILGAEAALACGSCRYEGGGFARRWVLSQHNVLRDIAAVFTVTTYQRP